MSKRHTILGGSQPIPPIPSSVLFQENLVFYAPLNKGELFDYISGEVGATSQYAWATWDDNEQMYQLGYDYPTLLGNDCTALLFTSPICMTNLARCVQNKQVTIVMRYKDAEFSGNSWRMARAYSMNKNSEVLYNNTYNSGQGMNMWLDGNRQGMTSTTLPSSATVLRTAIGVYTATNWKVYVNAVQKGNYSIGSEQWYAPTSLALCDKQGIPNQQSSQYNTKKHVIYAKDIRVYDKACTASEVQQLTNNVI